MDAGGIARASGAHRKQERFNYLGNAPRDPQDDNRSKESFLNDRATILWRRLDMPGHDTAALMRTPDGWHLSGVAVLAESDRPCRVEYEIDCDSRWLTRRCTLAGYVGATIITLDVARNPAGEWTVGGVPAASLKGCDDIDLGYLYESAGGSFRRELLTDDVGFVLDYPDLWRAEANL